MSKYQKQKEKAIVNSIYIIAALLCAWFVLSYLEIVNGNLYGGNYSDWNLLMMILKLKGV
jgi:hypothetical protein